MLRNTISARPLVPKLWLGNANLGSSSFQDVGSQPGGWEPAQHVYPPYLASERAPAPRVRLSDVLSGKWS
jgi:hypothetical protein